ncbi:macrophage mannose receptor 1-like [Salvelinus alpinus]
METLLYLTLLISGFYTPSSCLRQYHFISTSMTWTDAQSYCREKYTDLATVDDMEDLNRLITSDSSYNYWYWIGLKKGDSMKWHWSLADRRFYREGETEFRNWDTGTPQNGNCALMSTAGLWNNTSCDDQHHFICYDGKQDTNLTYVLIQENKTWIDAQSYCRQHHTDLVSVRNQTENTEIEKKISLRGLPVWIGPAVETPEKPQLKRQVYHFNSTSMTWTDAQSYCREKYTDLATVDDMEDLNRLITSVSSYYWSWIGLKKGDSMKWHWSLADRQFYREGETEFRNWDNGTPQNGNCALMSTAGLWTNTSCDDQHHFICYDGKQDTNLAYVLIQENKTWIDAQSYCRQHHTDLVSVRNQTESTEIEKKISLRGLPCIHFNHISFEFHMETLLYLTLLISGFYTPSSCLRQYQFISTYMTWTDAQSYCREKYTDLATVDDMEDLNRLITSVSVYKWSWIGLKMGDSMKWHWSLADRRFYRKGETEFRNGDAQKW